MSNTVYAIASGKGGVGKTTTAVNLGAAFTENGEDVVVVDADLGMANLVDFLDVDVDGPTLHDVLAEDADAMDAIYDAPGGVSVLPSGTSLDSFGKANPSNLQDAVADLREEFDVVLIDTGGGLSHDTVLPLGVVDTILLVSTPFDAALRDTAKSMEISDYVDSDVIGTLLTRTRDDPPIEDVASQVNTQVIATVPENDVVRESAAAGEPLSQHAPDSQPATIYRALATVLALGDDEIQQLDTITPDLIDAAMGGESATVDDEVDADSEDAEIVDDSDTDAETGPGIGTEDAEIVDENDDAETDTDADEPLAGNEDSTVDDESEASTDGGTDASSPIESVEERSSMMDRLPDVFSRENDS